MTYKINDKVYFGRLNGEKTFGEITKVNRKTYKVRTLESRGTKRDYAVGTVWTVPHSMVTPASDRATELLTGSAADLVTNLTDGKGKTPKAKVVFRHKRPDENILRDIRNVDNALSPENLHCDGEISRAAARRKATILNRSMRKLIAELGREPTDSELYAY